MDLNSDTYSANSYEAAMNPSKPVQHSNTMPRSFGYAGNAQNVPPAYIERDAETGDVIDSGLAPPPQQQQPMRKQRGFRSFGKGFFKMRSGKWSSSAPNLGRRALSLVFSLLCSDWFVVYRHICLTPLIDLLTCSPIG